MKIASVKCSRDYGGYGDLEKRQAIFNEDVPRDGKAVSEVWRMLIALSGLIFQSEFWLWL